MKKKVLFFLESLAGGGAEKVLSDLVTNLDKSKYSVTVCTVTDEGVYQKKVSECTRYHSFIKLEDIRRGRWSGIWTKIKIKCIYFFPSSIIYKVYIKNKYDIEIAFIEGFATKLIAGSSNSYSKKIAWVHTDMKKNPYADKVFKKRRRHIRAYQKYDRIVCVSEYVKKVFERKFFRSSAVTVQYNPVDEHAIKRLGSKELGWNRPHHLVIATIGRLTYQKGYFRLVKCINELKDKYDFEVWIIGDGEDRERLEQYIRRNHMEQYVRLLGFQENPYQYLEKCDAYVCSSYAEGFSTAATESLILGKPIFTVDCSGMQELFGPYKCGEIVGNSDGELFHMLERLLSGEYILDAYREDIEMRRSQFSITNSIKKIEDMLDR